jgi:hypothetical protein
MVSLRGRTRRPFRFPRRHTSSVGTTCSRISPENVPSLSMNSAQVGLAGQPVKTPPRDIVGARLHQAAQIGRGKPAGQRAQRGDAGAHEVVRPERRKQVGLRGRKLGLHAADIAPLPETLRRQGHVRAEQRIEDGAGGAQAGQDGLDGAVILGKLAHQFGQHASRRWKRIRRGDWERRIAAKAAPAGRGGARSANGRARAERAPRVRNRAAAGAGLARQRVRSGLERGRHDGRGRTAARAVRAARASWRQSARSAPSRRPRRQSSWYPRRTPVSGTRVEESQQTSRGKMGPAPARRLPNPMGVARRCDCG